MTSPLDVRLLKAADEAVRLFQVAAGTPYTFAMTGIAQDPAGDSTTLTIEFRIQHVGAVDGNEPPVSPFMEFVKRGELDPVEEVPDDKPEPVLPYYAKEEHLEADSQLPCGRCHWPKWKHYVDGSGGFATCGNFTEAKQLTLVK